MRKILNVLFLSLFLISITFAKPCSEKNFSEMKDFLDNSKQELTHFLYNKIYLTDKSNQLTKLEKDIHTCLQKNTQKIQDIQNLKKNFTPGGNLSQLQHMYDKKIWAIKNTIYQLENNLLAIDNLSILIQKQEKANNLQNNQINDFKNIQEHWRSYKADPNRSIQLTPLHEVFPYVYHLYQNQPMVLVLFLISGLIAGFFGKKIAFFLLHQPFVKKNRNIQLWMQYNY